MSKKVRIIVFVTIAMLIIAGGAVCFLLKDNSEKQEPQAIFVKGEEHDAKLF